MKKVLGFAFVMFAVLAYAPAAHAGPISSCFDNGTTVPGFSGDDPLLTCNLYETDANGDPSEVSSATDPFGPNDWFTPTYMILWDDLAFTELSDVVKFWTDGSSDFVTLTSEGPDLAAAYAEALAGAHSNILENPVAPTTFYVNYQSSVLTSDIVTNLGLDLGNLSSADLIALAFTGCAGATNCDTINVYSDEADENTQPPQVPEPTTLTLVGLGGLVSFLRYRRKTTV